MKKQTHPTLNNFILLFVLISLTSYTTAYSYTFTWTGATNSNWDNPENWDDDANSDAGDTLVPGYADDVLLVDVTNSPELSGNVYLANLSIADGAALNLGGYTLIVLVQSNFTTCTITNGTLDCRGSSASFTGSILDVTLVVVCDYISFSGCEFDQAAGFDFTSGPATIEGGNVFYGSLSITNSGLGDIIFGNSESDSYFGTVTLNDTGGTITLAGYGISYFYDQVIVNSKGNGVLIGGENGYAELNTTTLSIGTTGFTSGVLMLTHVNQTGGVDQNLTLTGTAVLNLIENHFEDGVEFSAPDILLKQNSFDARSIFTRTGTTGNENNWEGSNTFGGVFRLSNYSNGIINMQTNGGDIFVDSVTINAGSAAFYGGLAGETHLFGDLHATGNSLYFGTFGAESSYRFLGATNQFITGTTTLPFTRLIVDQSSGNLILRTSVSISEVLSFANGNIISDTTNLLIFLDDATYEGGGNTSFVDGPVKKIGNTAFTFPIGKGNALSIAGISAPSTSTDAFMTEYFEGVCAAGDSLDTNLTSVSSCGYWKILRTNGSSNVKITLGWDTTTCLDYLDTNATIAVWKGSKWQKKIADTVTTNTNNYGRFVTTSSVSDFGYFAVANVSMPLIRVESFMPGRKIDDFFGSNVWDVIDNQDVNMADTGYQYAAILQSPGTLRFPCGIPGNWWDWKKGGYIKDRKIGNTLYLLPEEYHDPELEGIISGFPVHGSVIDFYKSVYNTGCKPFLGLNAISSDDLFQSAYLYSCKQNNVPYTMMELGNEVYSNEDYNSTRLPTGNAYGELAITWGKNMKRRFNLDTTLNYSNFQIGLACTRTQDSESKVARYKTWNSTLFAALDQQSDFVPDAIILHDYITDAFKYFPDSTWCYGATNPNGFHQMISPFDGSSGYCTTDMEYIFSSTYRNFLGDNLNPGGYKGFKNEELDSNNLATNSEIVPGKYPIWITEYNFNEQNGIYHGSWAHGLAVALQTMLYLETDRIAKVNCFSLLGAAIFSSVFGDYEGFKYKTDKKPSPIDFDPAPNPGDLVTKPFNPTAAGYTLGLLAKAVRNTDHAMPLLFWGNVPRFQDYKRYGSIDAFTESQLYGWLFADSGAYNNQIVLLNLSDTAISIDVSHSLPFTIVDAYEGIYCDPAAFVTGDSTLFNVQTGHELTIVPEQAFSFFQNVTVMPYSIMRFYSKNCKVVLKPLLDHACGGTTTSLTAFGDPTLNYTWSIDDSTDLTSRIVNTPTGQSLVIDIGSSATTHDIEVTVSTDPNPSCASTQTIHISEKPTLSLQYDGTSTSVASPLVICNGSTLDWKAIFSYPSTGIPAWYHSLLINSNGIGVQESDTNAPLSFIPDTSSTYYVYAYDGTCAIEGDTVEIINPGLNLGDDMYVCSGTLFTFPQSKIKGLNTLPNVTFEWTNDTLVSTDSTPVFTVNAPDSVTYILTVHYDDNLSQPCTLIDSIKIYPVSCCSNPGFVFNGGPLDSLIAMLPDTLVSQNNLKTTYIIEDSIHHKSIDITLNGRLDITGHNLQFTHCRLKVGEASEIVVDRHFVLLLDGTIIDTCSEKVWKGVRVLESGTLKTNKFHDGNNNVNIRSSIQNAEYGISARKCSRLYLSHLGLKRNYVSLYVPKADSGQINELDLQMDSVELSCLHCNDTAPLLDPYFGHAPFGKVSFAGMYLNDAIATIGTKNADSIRFKELNNGIIAMNSNLIVTNSSFKNITNFDNYTVPPNAINGTGIFSGADVGKFASLIQIGLGGKIAFDSVYIGIRAFRSSLSARKNSMRHIYGWGIQSIASTDLSTTIADNDILAVTGGIALANSFGAALMNVPRNIISSIGSAPLNFAGLYSLDMLNVPNPNYFVACNEVSGNFLNGFLIQQNTAGRFYHNQAFITSSSMYNGFNFLGGDKMEVDNNTAKDGNLNSGIGFNFNLSSSSLITNNTSDSSNLGFNFEGDNSNSKFITNNIRRHFIGLHLDSSSIIGLQYFPDTVFSNSWLLDTNGSVYTSGFGAVNVSNDPGSAFYNQFRYDSAFALGSIKYPVYQIPGNGPWFRGITNTDSLRFNINDSCSSLEPHIISDQGTELDRLITKDSVHTGSFDPEISQMAAADLMDKLEDNEDLRNSEEYFADFYEANETEALGKQAKVRSAIKQIFGDLNNNRETIASNDSLIQIKLNKKCDNDSILSTAGLTEVVSTVLINLNKTLMQEVAEIIQATNYLLKGNSDSIAIKVALAKDLNDNVSPSTTIENNEKDYNDVFLRNAALGVYTLSSPDLSALQGIAIQCPFSGGKAVIKARSYLWILGDSTVYDDIYVCAHDENLRTSKNGTASTIDVYVIPNPGNGLCKFIYRLPKDEEAELKIFDSYGKVISKYSLTANSVSYSVNLENYSNGVYMFTVNSSSGLGGNGKLILIK